ncbi:MAG: DUF4329 domain-containing protein [Alphaproteobacteria bacterium]|nr:DUF4329 domain-containing protein [Alphaproteobacteria bacterium]
MAAPGGQPKGSTANDMALENKAFELLSAILPGSIFTRTEMGAVICRNRATGALITTDLRTSGEGLAVDVGLDPRTNHGCPSGTDAVAYYHTHPIKEVGKGSDGEMHGDPDFSTKDKQLANEHQLVAFLGSFDGLFRRYRPVAIPTTLVNGKPVQMLSDAEGRLLPETFNPTDILNRKLPTQMPRAPSQQRVKVAPPR